MGTKLKELGNWLGGVLVLGAFLSIPVLFIVGAEWLSVRVLPWLALASMLAFGVLLFVLLPMAAFRRSRGAASVGILLCSYLFGLTLWMEGLLYTAGLWGTWAVVVGLMIAGVGVVPMGMVATLFEGLWGPLSELVVLFILTFGARFLALWLSEKT